MTESAPKLLRLRAGLDDELRQGLESSAIEPSATELGLLTSKVSAAIALPLAVPAALTVAGGSKVLGLASVQTTLPLWKLGVWVLGGVALGVGLSGAVAATVAFSAADSPTPRAMGTKHLSTAVATAAAGPTYVVPVTPSAAPSVAPALRRALSAATPADEPAPRFRTDELSLLHRAQASLRSDPARALQLARDHELQFPDGVLVQEREVIVVESLIRQGRRAEAEARARRFAMRYPGSAHAVRIEEILRDATMR